jgi:hypothetical protein
VPVPAWWERNITEPGKLPLLVLFVASVLTFVVTRTITRSIRAGRGPFHDVTPGGLHVHHAIPGIILLITGATLSVEVTPVAPWREIAAALIGIGASLVLDEFALILHPEDDYWSAEGRVSVHAVALVTASLGLWIVGFNPIGVDDVGTRELGWRVVVTLFLLVTIPAAIVCAMKGKFRLALLAIFLPPVAVVGALRGAPRDAGARGRSGGRLRRPVGPRRRGARRSHRRAPVNALRAGCAPAAPHATVPALRAPPRW